MFFSSVFVAIEGQTVYTYHAFGLSWIPAKAYCECLGNLARLDTEAKQT